MPVPAPQYPVNLVLTGKRCLVVGGGGVARRKVEGLLAAGADVTVIAADFDRDLEGLEGVRRVRKRYEGGDAATGDYRLVIAATDDQRTNQQVHDDADAAGIWVNSADDPERCTFTLPAVVRNGPMLLTAATGGHSPALASHLKRRLEEDYGGADYRVLLELLAEARADVVAEGRSTEGLAWQTALDSDMLSLIRGGQISEARERLRTCLSSS